MASKWKCDVQAYVEPTKFHQTPKLGICVYLRWYVRLGMTSYMLAYYTYTYT
jgi:hypothetical protein